MAALDHYLEPFRKDEYTLKEIKKEQKCPQKKLQKEEADS